MKLRVGAVCCLANNRLSGSFVTIFIYLLTFVSTFLTPTYETLYLVFELSIPLLYQGKNKIIMCYITLEHSTVYRQ